MSKEEIYSIVLVNKQKLGDLEDSLLIVNKDLLKSFQRTKGSIVGQDYYGRLSMLTIVSEHIAEAQKILEKFLSYDSVST